MPKTHDPFGEFFEDDPLNNLSLDDIASFRNRDNILRRSRVQKARRDANNEVGVPPALTEEILAKRKVYRSDYILAHKELFPNSTGASEYGEDQKTAIRRFQSIVQGKSGGKLVQCEPRAFCKTSRAINQMVLGILEGDMKFALVVSSEIGKSADILEQIQTELLGNDALKDLYPGVFACFHAIEGKAVKCKSQTMDGQFTHIGWSVDEIRFPIIPGEPSSGAIILVRTKDNLRGISRKIRYGEDAGKGIRPDFVLLDDIQTDKDAKSPTLCANIHHNVKRAVMFGGSHTKKVKVVMTITPNKRDDVAHQFIQKEPSWEVAMYSMIHTMPKNMDLWDEFGRILLNFDKFKEGERKKAQRRACEFVKENYDVLHEGAKVSWDACFEYDEEDPLELSALHHAMIFFYEEGEEAFNFECQCKLDIATTEEEMIKATPEIIMSRVSHLPQRKVPVNCLYIATHVDCNQDILTYVTVASPTTFYPYIIDYGTYPKQPGEVWKKGKILNKLSDVYPDIQKEDVASLMYAGVMDLSQLIANTSYEREDGLSLQNRYIGFDTRWQGDHIVRAIRESPTRAFLHACQGASYDEKKKPMMEESALDRDLHYLCYTSTSTDRSVPMLKFDTNSIKTLVHRSFIARPGTVGSAKLFLPERQSVHHLYALHVIAEEPEIRVNVKDQRVVTVWTHNETGDNEFFDNTVGAFALLFKMGVSLKVKIDTGITDMKDYINQKTNW